jgi:hypothetical protein
MRDIGRSGELVPERDPPAGIQPQDHVFIEPDAGLAWRSDNQLDVVAAELLPAIRDGHIESKQPVARRAGARWSKCRSSDVVDSGRFGEATVAPALSLRASNADRRAMEPDGRRTDPLGVIRRRWAVEGGEGPERDTALGSGRHRWDPEIGSIERQPSDGFEALSIPNHFIRTDVPPGALPFYYDSLSAKPFRGMPKTAEEIEATLAWLNETLHRYLDVHEKRVA